MSTNWLDKKIEKYAPGIALNRELNRFRLQNVRAQRGSGNKRPGYAGGRTGYARQQTAISSVMEDIATESSMDNMVANAIQLYRDEPITRSIVDVTDTYLGSSKPTAATGDTAFDEEATEFFNDFWWGLADARRRPGSDFGTLQSLCSNSWWFMGDMLFGIFGDALLPYEGLQIRTPAEFRSDRQIVRGVRTEKAPPNRTTHYYVVNGGTTMFPKKGEFKRIRHNQAFYCPAKYWRTAQVRGTPELHSVIDALQNMDQIDAHLQHKIKMEAAFNTIEKAGVLGNMATTRMGVSSGGKPTEFIEGSQGMRIMVDGDPEHDIRPWKMDSPGGTYVKYMESYARKICAGVGFPYEIALHFYTNGSYTANRAARVDFKKFIQKRWIWRNKVLNQPVYNWVIAKAIKAKEIRPAPVNRMGRSMWHKATWSLPHFPQIDEGKEARAAKDRWGLMQASLEDWGQEQGRTGKDMRAVRKREILAMKADAEEVGVSLPEFAPGLFAANAAQDKESQQSPMSNQQAQVMIDAFDDMQERT